MVYDNDDDDGGGDHDGDDGDKAAAFDHDSDDEADSDKDDVGNEEIWWYFCQQQHMALEQSVFQTFDKSKFKVRWTPGWNIKKGS